MPPAVLEICPVAPSMSRLATVNVLTPLVLLNLKSALNAVVPVDNWNGTSHVSPPDKLSAEPTVVPEALAHVAVEPLHVST